MSWKDRIWAEFRAGTLTRAYRDVLLTLHTYRGTGGQCWPSHETLADRADCCTRTVQRALRAARELDLVHQTERRVRAGWRWLRTSNLYRLVMPAGPVQPGRAAPFSYGVQKLRKPFSYGFQKACAFALPDTKSAEGRGSKKEALDAMIREAAAAPNLLAERREVLRKAGIAT